MAAAETPDPSALFRLDGRVALVTGASSGIGERIARVLHAAGASVVAAARRRDRLDALVAECPGMVAVTADVSTAEGREQLFEAAGPVDVLVNNAGVGTPMPALDEPLEHWHHVVE